MTTRRAKEPPRSRADWLMPYAERYLDLVIERKWQGSRMHPRDVSKLDSDIAEALVDFEAARSREDRREAERLEEEAQRAASPKRRSRPKKTQNLLRSWQGQEHPWNGRMIPPKK